MSHLQNDRYYEMIKESEMYQCSMCGSYFCPADSDAKEREQFCCGGCETNDRKIAQAEARYDAMKENKNYDPSDYLYESKVGK